MQQMGAMPENEAANYTYEFRHPIFFGSQFMVGLSNTLVLYLV